MRDRPASLMFFAAGFGTRMGALTRDRPKPLVEVAGKPLFDHALTLARGAGIDRLVANTHYHADLMEAHLAERYVTASREEPEILDTGGGLRQALPLLGDGPVFTLNTDAVWTGPNPLAALAEAWDAQTMDALLMCVPADRARGHRSTGDFDIDDAGRMRRGGPLVYTGAQILRTEGLAAIPEAAFSLNRLWDTMLAEGRLYGCVHPGGWCDVGHPGGMAEAEALLREAQDV